MPAQTHDSARYGLAALRRASWLNLGIVAAAVAGTTGAFAYAATGKPDPARMAAFLAAHPESGRALALIKAQTPTAGFADASYNSLNTFRFVAASGASTPVRWSMVADDAPQAAQPAITGKADPNGLFDALENRVEHGPLLSARSAAYSEPFTRRSGEPKSLSAVQLSSNAKGARS